MIRIKLFNYMAIFYSLILRDFRVMFDENGQSSFLSHPYNIEMYHMLTSYNKWPIFRAGRIPKFGKIQIGHFHQMSHASSNIIYYSITSICYCIKQRKSQNDFAKPNKNISSSNTDWSLVCLFVYCSIVVLGLHRKL